MAEPEITIKKMAYYQSAAILGRDNEGRLLIRCPSPGCGETATVADDGEVHCPTGDAQNEFLRQAMLDLMSAD